MGATTSTTRAHVSLKVVSRKGKKNSKASNSRGRVKRSSVNRPVLQLQVKPATLERVRLRLTSTSGPHLVTRKTLNSLARDSGIYDTVITRSRTCSSTSHNSDHTTLTTRSRTCSNASRNSDHAHHPRTCSMGSHDSMILLEIINDEHGNNKDMDDNDYDHVDIEFRNLSDCMFGHISLITEVEEEEEDEEESHCTYGLVSLVAEVEKKEGSMDEEKRRGGEKD